MKTAKSQVPLQEPGTSLSSNEEADRLNSLAWEIMGENPGQALEYALDAVAMSEQLGYDRGVTYGLGYKGYAQAFLSDFEDATATLHRAQALAERLEDPYGLGLIFGALASIETSLGNFDQALAYAFKALGFAEEAGNRRLKGWITHGLGMGYHEIGDFDRSLEFYRDSLTIFEQDGFDLGIARALNGVGSVLQKLGDDEKALEHHRRSLEIFVTDQNPLGEARALNDIGSIFQRQERLEEALDHHQKSLRLREKVGSRQAQSTSLIHIGEVHRQMGRNEAGLDFFNRALTLASEIKSKPRIYQAHEALAELYEELGDARNALFHQKAFHEIKEAVFGEEANAKMANLRISVEVEQAEKEAEMGRRHNVALQQKNNQLEDLLKDLQETQSHLIQSEKMAALGAVVAGVVHEMNTPVGAINSGIDVIKRCVDNILGALTVMGNIEDLELQPQFSRSIKLLGQTSENAVSAGERIARILTSLKSFTRLDESSFQKADVHEGLDAALILLEHELKDTIQIDKQYGDLPRIACYPGELNQAFMNLLLNSIEATRGAGTITIRTCREGENVLIEISDMGVGISREQLAHVFVPNFNHDGARVKAGMGLFTVYNIVQKHEGKIDVESELGKGTTFALTLPVNALRPPIV